MVHKYPKYPKSQNVVVIHIDPSVTMVLQHPGRDGSDKATFELLKEPSDVLLASFSFLAVSGTEWQVLPMEDQQWNHISEIGCVWLSLIQILKVGYL